MALIKCPECGKEISDQADKCPSCGFPIKAKKKKKEKAQKEKKDTVPKKRIIILASVITFVVVGAIGLGYLLGIIKPKDKTSDNYKVVVSDNNEKTEDNKASESTTENKEASSKDTNSNDDTPYDKACKLMKRGQLNDALVIFESVPDDYDDKADLVSICNEYKDIVGIWETNGIIFNVLAKVDLDTKEINVMAVDSDGFNYNNVSITDAVYKDGVFYNHYNPKGYKDIEYDIKFDLKNGRLTGKKVETRFGTTEYDQPITRVSGTFLEENTVEEAKEDDKNNSTTSKADTTEDNNKESNLVNGMRPEFKTAMDDYEEFFDEYCKFMNDYNKNPSDAKLISDYSKMLQKEENMIKSFEKWKGDMNDAETVYYIEVQTRVDEKLLKLSVQY